MPDGWSSCRPRGGLGKESGRARAGRGEGVMGLSGIRRDRNFRGFRVLRFFFSFSVFQDFHVVKIFRDFMVFRVI